MSALKLIKTSAAIFIQLLLGFVLYHSLGLTDFSSESSTISRAEYKLARPRPNLEGFQFLEWQQHAIETESNTSTATSFDFQCEIWDTVVPKYNDLLASGKARANISSLQSDDIRAWEASEGAGPRRRRVLFLTSLHSFNTHSDRWFYHLFQDAAKYPNWEVHLWGLGFPGYNPSLSLGDNLRQNWPLNPAFDVLFAMYTWLRPTNFYTQHASYEDFNLPGSPLFARLEHEFDGGDDPGQARQHLLNDANLRMVHFTTYTAYVTPPIADQIIPQHPDLFFRLAPHAVPSFVLDMPDDDLASVVDCSVPGGTWTGPWSKAQRESDFFFAGAINFDYYKLRQRVFELITNNGHLMKHHLEHYQHPGYLEVEVTNLSPRAECEMRLDRILPQYKRFFSTMRRARICIVTRSDRPGMATIGRFAIRKYQEAMAAGCLIVGDLPDNKDVASHVAVPVDASMPLEELAQAFDRAVDDYNAGVYDDHIRRAYCAARTHYNYVDIIDKYMEPVFREADAHFNRTR